MITVIIGTYGEERWQRLANERAYPSALAAFQHAGMQGEIRHEHGTTLAEARNQGGFNARHPWLCFLDADDELDPGYLAAMATAIRGHRPPKQLFTPAVAWKFGRRPRPPKLMPEVPIEQGNWLIIGTVMPREGFVWVGGFEEWPMYEDWALFARMQKGGARVVKVPDAIYIAHRGRGRNNPAEGRPAKLRAHDMIRRAVFPELYEEAS